MDVIGLKLLLTAKLLSYHLELNNSRGASTVAFEKRTRDVVHPGRGDYLGAKCPGLLEGFVKDNAHSRGQIETANTWISYGNCEASLPI